MQCGLALVIRSIDLCPSVKQLGDILHLARGRGDEQRRPSERVARLDVGRVGDEELRYAEVVCGRGPMQWSAPVLFV